MRSRVVASVLGFLAIGIVIATCSHREEQRSITVAYFTPAVSGDVLVEADLTLPRVPGNRAWYGVWLMLLGSGDPQHQPFLQGGLMRREADPARTVPEHGLAPFVAYSVRGRSLTYLDMPRLHPPVVASHHFVIGKRAGTLFVTMDGVVIHTERADAMLDRGEAPTFQLAVELFAYGDHAVGTIDNVRIRTGARGESRPAKPVRYFIDRATCLVPTRSGYAARGVFTAGARTGFLDALPQSRSRCPFD